ncbi:MAG: leucyl/phenylalanyl-tRNA--protein transferase [Armatimonadota bacterium]
MIKRLSTELLWGAYLEGAFPMGSDDSDEIHFYTVDERCLFPIEGIRVSRSLAKTLRNPHWSVTFDQCFDDVVWACRREPGNNWITPEILRVYSLAHREGWAHSCEVWWEGELVGGTYGVAMGTCFSAESMFHRRTDASKVALYHMVRKCRELGYTIFDAEVTNPHLESLGSYTVPIEQFLQALQDGLSKVISWTASQ